MRKLLVIGIILLFIGASVVSGFNAHSTVKNTLNKSTLKTSTSIYSTFILGKIANFETRSNSNYISFRAVKIIVITFSPFRFKIYSSGEYFEIFKDHKGFISIQFIFALTNAFIPKIDCIPQNSENRLQIVYADAYIKWSNIKITTDNPGVSWRVYDGGGTPLDDWNSTANITTDVWAGDYIQLTGTTCNASVTLRYIPTNLLIGSWTVNL